MTAPEEQKEKTAAVLFAGFMALALGGAGLLVAAVAVAAERAWSGGAGESQRSAERRQGWLDRQRSWLDADHRGRLARSAAVKSWLDAGADPETRPAVTPRRSRFADGWRRLVAHLSLAGVEFATGARDGWRAANKVRKSGGTFREIATARPGSDTIRRACAGCGKPLTARAGQPDVKDPRCPECRAQQLPAKGKPQTEEKSQAQACRSCRKSMPLGFDGRCDTCRQGGSSKPGPAEVPDPAAADKGEAAAGRTHDGSDPQPPEGFEPATPEEHATHHENSQAGVRRLKHLQDSDCRDPGCVEYDRCYTAWLKQRLRTQTDQASETTEGAPVPDDATQTPAGESNAAVLRQKLENIQTGVRTLSAATDNLSTAAGNVRYRAGQAQEFANNTGQSSRTVVATDACTAAADKGKSRLGEFSEAFEHAVAALEQASRGIEVAERAEEQLRAAGADGRAVNTADAPA